MPPSAAWRTECEARCEVAPTSAVAEGGAWASGDDGVRSLPLPPPFPLLPLPWPAPPPVPAPEPTAPADDLLAEALAEPSSAKQPAVEEPAADGEELALLALGDPDHAERPADLGELRGVVNPFYISRCLQHTKVARGAELPLRALVLLFCLLY